MQGALIILAFTVVVGVILRLTHKPDPAPSGEEETQGGAGESAECCGVHAICEKQMTLAEGPDYFDDEELDRFKGHDPATYSPDEVEEFREVMLTMEPSEVYAWASALTRRDIPFPTSLRPELLMLISEE